jgi:hypothetical protein
MAKATAKAKLKGASRTAARSLLAPTTEDQAHGVGLL